MHSKKLITSSEKNGKLTQYQLRHTGKLKEATARKREEVRRRDATLFEICVVPYVGRRTNMAK